MQADFIKEEIVKCPLDAESAQDAIQKLGKLLLEAGYIKAEYIEAVMEREKNFPTGIALAGAAIAIPHATPEGMVLKDGIAVARLANKVEFHSMEDPDDTVEAELVFMLSVKDPGQHLDVLNALFTTFQNEDVVDKLIKSNKAQDIYTILKDNLVK